jgi:hypothetical protein
LDRLRGPLALGKLDTQKLNGLVTVSLRILVGRAEQGCPIDSRFADGNDAGGVGGSPSINRNG